jgi:type VI secretion system secreted protein VgrG
VYYFSSSAELTGTLLLNAGDNDTASWTFVIGTTLTTASASSVEIINSGAAGSYTGNINWIVETYATLGTTTTFLGDILAEDLVTLNAGATIGCGGAIGLTGAVTLDTNTISTGCTVAGNGDPVEAPSSVPESGTLTLLPSGLLAAIALLAFRKSTLSR